MKNDQIECLFKNIINIIDLILETDFYVQKKSMIEIKKKIQAWFNDYKTKNTLTTILASELEFISLEITDFFDIYLKSEPVNKNYSERLSYYFGTLEIEWKNEMLREKTSHI